MNKSSAYSQKPWAYRPGFSAHEPPSHATTKDVIFNVNHCGEERNRLFIIGSEELVKLVSLKAACSLKLLENLCTADEENAACTHLLTHYWHLSDTKVKLEFHENESTPPRECLSRWKDATRQEKVFGFAPNCHIWMPSCTKTTGNAEAVSSVWPWMHHIGAVSVSIFIISC